MGIAGFGLILTGCTQFPELDRTQTAALAAADYPALLPLEPILADTALPAPEAVAIAAATQSVRLNRLRARAAELRSDVLDLEEKKRLGNGLKSENSDQDVD